MNILFLADAVFADKPGGSRVVARELAKGLEQRGHAVTFLVARQTGDAPDDERQGAIRIVRYGGAGQHATFVREGREKAAALWQETPFDIVHTHFAYGAVGPVQSIPAEAKHVRSFYGPWDAEGWVEDTAKLNSAKGPLKIKAALLRAAKHRMRYRVEAQSLARSKAVIVLSEHSKQEVLSYGPLQAKLVLSQGGVDTARFSPPAGGREDARQALGLPPHQIILFSVRRLAPRMGLDNLIRAMQSVVAQHPDALLLLGGKGPERERLEKLSLELGLEKNVRFLGFIADADLATYYGAADAFVLPTTALEGFGLVTVEALACGTPAVGTPIGATPEILGGLDRRLLTASPDAAGIAQGLLDFLGGSWRQELTPQRVRDFVLQRYTWEKHVDDVEAAYSFALEQ